MKTLSVKQLQWVCVKTACSRSRPVCIMWQVYTTHFYRILQMLDQGFSQQIYSANMTVTCMLTQSPLQCTVIKSNVYSWPVLLDISRWPTTSWTPTIANRKLLKLATEKAWSLPFYLSKMKVLFQTNILISFSFWRRFFFLFFFFFSEQNNTHFKFKKTWCTICSIIWV